MGKSRKKTSPKTKPAVATATAPVNDTPAVNDTAPVIDKPSSMDPAMLAEIDALITKRNAETYAEIEDMVTESFEKFRNKVVETMHAMMKIVDPLQDSVKYCSGVKCMLEDQMKDFKKLVTAGQTLFDQFENFFPDHDIGSIVVKQNPVCKITELSRELQSLPERCSPLPRKVSVQEYLSDYLCKTEKQKDEAKVALSWFTIPAYEHDGTSLTADYITQMISTGADVKTLCEAFKLLKDRSRDPDTAEIFKTMDRDAILRLAASKNLSEIPLRPRDPAGLDAEFTIRRKLLIHNYNDPYHIFDYLEHLKDALAYSRIPAPVKCKRLINLLPPPWIDWATQYGNDDLHTVMECRHDPIPDSITEAVAEDAVDGVIDSLALFLEYKDNPAIGEEFFKARSWAPLRCYTAHTNLLYQLEGEKPAKQRKQVTNESLARVGTLTQAEMDFLCDNTSEMNVKSWHELLQVCQPMLRYFHNRLRNETDIDKLCGNNPLLREMGIEAVKMGMELSIQAMYNVPFIPDQGSFSRLYDIFDRLDIEYVDDEINVPEGRQDQPALTSADLLKMLGDLKIPGEE